MSELEISESRVVGQVSVRCPHCGEQTFPELDAGMEIEKLSWECPDCLASIRLVASLYDELDLVDGHTAGVALAVAQKLVLNQQKANQPKAPIANLPEIPDKRSAGKSILAMRPRRGRRSYPSGRPHSQQGGP